MGVYAKEVKIESSENDVTDLTDVVRMLLKESKMKNGTVTVHSVRSVCAVTTIEYEPGCVKDIKDLIERLVPKDRDYAHQERWHDNNGYSHMRSSLIGPSITIPFINQKLCMEPWQQVVFINYHPGEREWEVAIVFNGE